MKSSLIKKIVAFILCGLMLLSVFSMLIYVAAAEEDEDIDLAVTSVAVSSSMIYENDYITANATVRNLGSSDINPDTSLSFYVDGKILQTVKVKDSIASGSRAVISTLASRKMGFGTHRITAILNRSNSYTETDYSNNSIKTRVTVIDETNPHPSDTPLPVELDYVDTVEPYIVEAEDCDLYGGTKSETTNLGYRGDGYVTEFSKEGAGFVFTYNAEQMGNHSVNIRYSTTSEAKKQVSCAINNDGSARSPIVFTGQKMSDSWASKSVTMFLQKGENTIRIFMANGDSGGVLIDRMEITPKTAKKITGFYFLKKNNPSLDGDIECTISNGKITAFVPYNIDLTDLVADYVVANGTSVKVQGVEQQSGVTHNNFTNGHYYVVSDNVSTQSYSVYLEKIKTDYLPNVYVDLDDSVTAEQKNTLLNGYQAADKDMKLPCSVTLTTDSKTNLFGVDKTVKLATLKEAHATINLRGNSTLGAVKKPYKIKLDSKANVLDMSKSKHWVLIASYDDKSFMRNYMGYELAHTCNNMPFASKFRYVNLFLDGKYNGLYLIGEQIKIASDRVNITEIKSAAAADITGGYIIELNERRDELPELLFEASFKNRAYPFSIKQPDEDVITPEMNAYIKDYVQSFLDSLNSPTTHEYENYIEVDTFIDWYITMELMRSHDASGFSSVYLHKDAGGKLCMGPVWDFNPGSGNVNYGSPIGMDTYQGLHIGGAIWWRYLFKDEKFTNAVKARWQELYSTGFDGFLDKVDMLEEYLNVPTADNFKRWDCLDIYVWAQPKVLHSYEAEVEMFRQWLKLRIEWLNGVYGK